MSEVIVDSNVMTTKKVEKILEKEKYAVKLKRTESLWHERKVGVRKSNISFAMTKEERQEYTKCKLSVFYFAQKFCKIKREDGTIGEIELRDYQKEMIKLFNNNRYSILMASRQIGKCLTFNTLVNIMDEKGNIFKINLGKLYYQTLSEQRKLTTIEKIKMFLYKTIDKLEQ